MINDKNVRGIGLFLLLMTATAGASEIIILDADRQMGYADHLFSIRDWETAAGEYKRFAYFFPDDPRSVRALYQAGMALFHQNRFQDAADLFSHLASRKPSETLSREDWETRAYFRMSECFLRLESPDRAELALFTLTGEDDDPEIRDLAFYELGWMHLEAHHWDLARKSFSFIRPESQDTFRIDGLTDALTETETLPRKDPVLAGILSILPGAGYLYLERYQDALTAFLLNGALMIGAYQAFKEDNPALGALAAVVGIGFYSGNVYGTVTSAYKYNDRRADDFVNGIRNLRLHLTRGPSSDGMGLTLISPF